MRVRLHWLKRDFGGSSPLKTPCREADLVANEISTTSPLSSAVLPSINNSLPPRYRCFSTFRPASASRTIDSASPCRHPARKPSWTSPARTEARETHERQSAVPAEPRARQNIHHLADPSRHKYDTAITEWRARGVSHFYVSTTGETPIQGTGRARFRVSANPVRRNTIHHITDP